MPKNSRSRLLALAKRDYRPNAWRRQDDIVELLSQFEDQFRTLRGEFGRWIPYSMHAVDAVRDALVDGAIELADVPQVTQKAYLWAFERNKSRVTRSIVRMAINAN